MVALLLDLRRELLQPRVRRQEQVAHLVRGRRRAADEAAHDLAEEQLGARRRRVDADAQPRHVDALGDHQHRHEPRRRAGREARDPRRRVGGVGMHDVRPLAGDPRQPPRELLGVLLVDRHHEPAGVAVRAGPQRPQLLVRVAQDVRDPVAVRVERRAQPPRGLRRGQHDVEVRAAHAAVADPLHVAAVGVERHGPADAVDERLRVAVAVVGARDRRPRRRPPTGSARCPSETACRRAAAGTAPARTPARSSGPRWRPRPCDGARRRSAASGARRSGGDAPRSRPRPSRRSPRRRAGRAARARPRSAGWARARSRSGPRRPPTGGRCASSARPRRPAPRGPRRASGGPRAARTWSCRRRASRRRGTPRRRGRRRRPRRPAATRAVVGPRARAARTDPSRRSEREQTSQDAAS